MPASSRAPAVDFGAAVSLALPLDFSAPHPRHFGAPAATSEPFRVSGFEGEVALGSSCNCRRVTLVPHCNGTHTESASHLTLQQRPLHELLPVAPMPALLLKVRAVDAHDTREHSSPAPRHGDRLITRASLLATLQRHGDAPARALLLDTGTHWQDESPPYLTLQLVEELVSRGVEHLVTDLPSIDRLHDEGRLAAHRVFFGLPQASVDLSEARRAHCTITELASFPPGIADGPCALQIQIPCWSGDAVPSRPLWLPLVHP